MKRRIRMVESQHVLSSRSSLRPELTLSVLTQGGVFHAVHFVVDTGAIVSVIPIALAQANGIDFDTRREITIRGSTGTGPAYASEITVRLFGQQRTWPCYFTPAPPQGQTQPRRTCLLGRTGFLSEDCTICVKRRYLTVAPSWALSRAQYLLAHALPDGLTPAWPLERPI